MNRIDVDSMTTDQKLKLLQLSLHYVLPKLRSTETKNKVWKLANIYSGGQRNNGKVEIKNYGNNFKDTSPKR